MRTTQALSITLPVEMAQMVKDKVSSGEYASESEVIRAGLRALSAQNAAIDKWLLEEVLPAADAQDADPGRAIPIAETRKRLQSFMDDQRAGKSERK